MIVALTLTLSARVGCGMAEGQVLPSIALKFALISSPKVWASWAKMPRFRTLDKYPQVVFHYQTLY